jgi:hypothetical protein
MGIMGFNLNDVRHFEKLEKKPMPYLCVSFSKNALPPQDFTLHKQHLKNTLRKIILEVWTRLFATVTHIIPLPKTQKKSQIFTIFLG